ncbi:putative leucine-rich repeat-containing protein DDB_G0290503 [Leptopilina boulardi]|uniref:putative leucine-rich repeat-containing protein DDB_G0290503 n=1 Tax=Leptopilina boulardi TaxID=63433 RepID=UPI0021F65F7C|nr:putative leucine-rich repeat-containing protein DDB_G0290503 [Leptopilina boulardi]
MTRLIISIEIIFGLIFIVNGNNDEFSQQDLKYLENALHESSKYMTSVVKEEDIVICIGATRAGKSTLINYLIENKLKAEKVTNYQPITITKVDSQSLGPEIGIGSTSKTTIPTRWISKKLPELAIWDAPGFDDNRGAVQDITNAFYIYQLLQKVKSLKIVLIVDINDILHDNIKPFVSVLKSVEILMGDKMRNYFTSMSIIFTKVPNIQDDIPLDMQFINEKLTYQFLSNSEMQLSQISKEFIQFLINNNNHIALFKRPQIGLVTSAIDVNIFTVIKNSNRIEKNSLMTINPSISDHSKICLFKVRETLYSVKAFQELQDIVKSFIDRKVNDLNAINDAIESENRIIQIKNDLNELNTKLHNAIFYTKSFPEKLQILQIIDNNIIKKVEEHNLLEKFKLMEFVDKLLNLKESIQLDVGIQTVLKSSMLKVQECINSAQTKINSISQKRDEIRRMEEERRRQEEIAKLNAQLEEQRRENERRPKKKSFWRRIFG